MSQRKMRVVDSVKLWCLRQTRWLDEALPSDGMLVASMERMEEMERLVVAVEMA